MKALTLWQPYAQAIALGLKKYETRSWPTKHRGRIAVHASVKPLSRESMALANSYGITDMCFGEFIVICDLKDCILMDEKFIKSQTKIEIDFGDWRVGRYAWELKIIKILQPPVPAKGYQGLWNTDAFPDFENLAETQKLLLF